MDAARMRTEAVLDAHPYIPMETSKRDLGIMLKREALLDNLNSEYVLRGVP